MFFLCQLATFLSKIVDDYCRLPLSFTTPHHAPALLPHIAIKGIFYAVYIFRTFCIICTSANTQRSAHRAVPFQVATHPGTDKGCCGLGRSRIRTGDCWITTK
jgi:hypothetical protein